MADVLPLMLDLAGPTALLASLLLLSPRWPRHRTS
jgi:hypothetical protein